jgi:hypothetical protein
MKRFVLGLAVALAAGPAFAAQVGGHYNVQGTNFDGSQYSGTADITVTSNSTCNIEWSTGSSTSSGFCMLNSNAFAAAYVLGNSVGLVVYEVKGTGELDGIWTIAGENGAGTEVLTPAR